MAESVPNEAVVVMEDQCREKLGVAKAVDMMQAYYDGSNHLLHISEGI